MLNIIHDVSSKTAPLRTFFSSLTVVNLFADNLFAEDGHFPKRLVYDIVCSFTIKLLRCTSVFSSKNQYIALGKSGTSSCETCSLNELSISPVLPGFGLDPSKIAEVFEIQSTTPVPASPGPLEPASQQPAATSEVTTLTRPSKQRQSTLLEHMFTKKRKVSGDVILQAEQVEVHVENAEEPSLPASSFEIPTGPTPITTSTSHSLAVGFRFPSDIGNFVNISNPLTEQQNYDILCNVWKTEETFFQQMQVVDNFGMTN